MRRRGRMRRKEEGKTLLGKAGKGGARAGAAAAAAYGVYLWGRPARAAGR
jgi:hypothetical protein